MTPEETIQRKLQNLLVIKFGGKALSKPERIRKLAEKTFEFHKDRPTLVVVSAMGDETNRLIDLADTVTEGECSPDDVSGIAAFGENLSAHVFCAALKSLGAESIAVTPSSEYWPIFGKQGRQVKLAREKINQNIDVEILEDYSKEKILGGLAKLLEKGVIPVVSGFLALTEDGKLITLGRGGSDTSAFLLGKLLEASEVIIVTDVKGVMKADPSRVGETELVNYISIDEIDSVTRSGGQVLHPQSLSYKTDKMHARIVHFEEEDFQESGTEIVGFYKARLKGIQKKLALLTIVGEEISSHQTFWKELGELLGNLNALLFGLSFTESFIGFYILDEHADELYQNLNNFVQNKPYIKNVIQRREIARLNLSSRDNADNPDMISDICDTLSERGITVIEVITNQSDISVFVDWSERKEAGKLFKRLATDINLKEVLKDST